MLGQVPQVVSKPQHQGRLPPPGQVRKMAVCEHEHKAEVQELPRPHDDAGKEQGLRARQAGPHRERVPPVSAVAEVGHHRAQNTTPTPDVH